MSGALSLALTPAPLVIALALAWLAGPRRWRWARWAAPAALAATIVLLAADAVPVVAGGRILASFGQALPGIPYLFRADGIGMTLAFAATSAALLTLLGGRALQPRRAPALVVCVLGSVLAAVAGNAVILFAGVELANIGTFLMFTEPGRRPGRAALLTLGLEHAGALGLLAATANLQGSVGTSDFSALPAGVVTPAIAVPWALGATLRLLAPAIAPLRTGVATAAWAATAAVPTGALMLLRLREAAGGVEPAAGTATLAVAGALVAAAGVVIMARRSATPAGAGRGLCLVVAGPVIALAGMSEAIAATAVAAGVGALEIAAAASAAWERCGDTATERGLAAASLVATAGLPLGFGATALVLELSAAVGLGAVGLPLLLALGLSAAAAAAAAVRLAGAILRRGAGAVARRDLPAPLGVIGLAAAVAGAVVPGAFAGWLNGGLGTPGTLADAGASAVSGPAGGWPGGYFAVAALILAAGCLAAFSLSGIRLPQIERLPSQERTGRSLAIPLSQVRPARRAARALQRMVPVVDAWALQQPQLPLIAAGGLIAVLLIR
ncbi:MAG TPA: hypothetical protein VF155_04025 [Candidatus Dormibacteraeota bacterium]